MNGPETVEAPAVTESRAKKLIDFSKKAVHALWLPSMIANLAGVAYLTLAEAGKEVAKNNPLLLQVMTAAGVVQLLGGAHALERRRSARKAAVAVAAAEAEAAKMGSEPEKAPEPEKAAEPEKAPEPEKAAEPADPEKDTDPDKTATDSEAESNDPDSEEDVAAVTGSPVLNAAGLARKKGSQSGDAAPAAPAQEAGRVTRRRKVAPQV